MCLAGSLLLPHRLLNWIFTHRPLVRRKWRDLAPSLAAIKPPSKRLRCLASHCLPPAASASTVLCLKQLVRWTKKCMLPVQGLFTSYKSNVFSVIITTVDVCSFSFKVVKPAMNSNWMVGATKAWHYFSHMTQKKSHLAYIWFLQYQLSMEKVFKRKNKLHEKVCPNERLGVVVFSPFQHGWPWTPPCQGVGGSGAGRQAGRQALSGSGALKSTALSHYRGNGL